MKYYDVENLSDLPPFEKGYKYFDFIGGTKEIRCFLSPKNKSRGEFIEENQDLLDECLKPIYKNKGVCVKQDASYPLPGFYIISVIGIFDSIDAIDEITNLRVFLIIQEIRKAMREVLEIDQVFMHYEEKNKKSSDVHYWLLPIYGEYKSKRLSIFNIKEYLKQYKFKENKEIILKNNQKIRSYISENKLIKKDNDLIKKLNIDD